MSDAGKGGDVKLGRCLDHAGLEGADLVLVPVHGEPGDAYDVNEGGLRHIEVLVTLWRT